MKTIFTILLVCLVFSSVSADVFTVEDGIRAKMFEQFQLDTAMYEIEILSHHLKENELQNEEIIIKPISLKEPIGLFNAIATIVQDGQEIESSQVRMRIRKFNTVLVTTDKLKRHNELTNSNTSIQKVETTNLRNKPYLTLEETEGYRVKGSIQKGIPLTSKMLEKIPDIESGRETTIIYSGAIFKITADGIALQSGSAGDFIKVKNKTSKKIIIARVIDSHHVAIDP